MASLWERKIAACVRMEEETGIGSLLETNHAVSTEKLGKGPRRERRMLGRTGTWS